MKIVKKISFVGTTLFFSVSLQGAEALEGTPAAEAVPAQAEKEKNPTEAVEQVAKEVAPTEGEIMSFFKTLGWTTAHQSGIKNLGPSASEAEAYTEGIKLALADKECPEKLGEIMKPMQEYFQKRAGEYAQKRQEELKSIAEKNRSAGKAYVEDLKKKNPAIKSTASGLHYLISKEGNKSLVPAEEDRVEISYTGSFIDGKVFDASEQGKSIDFELNGVIPGIREGLLQIGEGGEITIYIPDSLAYGENDIPGIPAGSCLVFDIKLTKVHKATPEPAAEAEEGKTATTEEVKPDTATEQK